jgi:hypothetical protein
MKLIKTAGKVFAVSAAGVGAAQAAVPAAVTTAITDATVDVATIGGAVLVVAITIATFIWLRRPMH